jgi:hypothetical protein
MHHLFFALVCWSPGIFFKYRETGLHDQIVPLLTIQSALLNMHFLSRETFR